jgi:spore coat polysaccharide biosynthesis protein SpsF
MLAILQARMGSSRLPGKVLKEVNGRPVLLWQIDRIKRSSLVSDLIVATTKSPVDDVLCKVLNEEGIRFWRGDEEDVLKRFCEVIRLEKPEWIMRLTGDCPLFMPKLCDEMLQSLSYTNLDYFSNTLVRSFPRGCDIEIVRASCLLERDKVSYDKQEREHVTYGLYTRPNLYSCGNFKNKFDQSRHRWTLDTSLDFDFIKLVYSFFISRELEFTYDEVMELLMNGQIPEYLD